MHNATETMGAETTRNEGWALHVAAYGAFLFAAVFLTLPTVIDMVGIWASSSAYHHGFFVAPAALWMIIVHGWRPEYESDRRLGFILVAAGTLVWLIGRAAAAGLVEQIGFVTILIGGVGAVFGDRALTLWAWPLVFLYFMVPAGGSVVPFLQLITAKTVVFALSLFGFELAIDGVLIQTPVGAFAIAEACAGLRVLTAALMVAAVFAYVAFEGWGKRIAFLLFAIVIAMAANAVRAFFLILVPLLRGEQADVGLDHYVVGWLVYLVVLIALMLIGRRFADRRVAAKPNLPAPPLRPLAVAIAVAIVAGGTGYAKFIVESAADAPAPRTMSLFNASGWRILPPPQNWAPVFAAPDRRAGATYDREGERVYASLAYFSHDRRGAEIAGGGHAPHDGADWRRIGSHEAVVYLFGASETRRFDRLAGPENRRLLTLTVYWLDDEVYWRPESVKLAQVKMKLAGDNPPGGVIVLAASYRRDPNEAVALIRQYASDLEAFEDWRRRLDAD